MLNLHTKQSKTYQLRFCLTKMLVYYIKNRVASFLDEKFTCVNLHKIFCKTRLLWDQMVKTTGVTVFVSSVCIWSGLHYSGHGLLLQPAHIHVAITPPKQDHFQKNIVQVQI